MREFCPRMFLARKSVMPVLRGPNAGERLKRGHSGEVSASMFGPPLPVDRPG